MKWFGEHIWDLISRFRYYVYIEKADASTSTKALVVDENGKVGTNSSIASGGVDSVTVGPAAVSTGTVTTITPNVGSVIVSPNAYAGTTNVGHVPTGGGGLTFLRGDGTWVTPTDTIYTLPVATASSLGGVELGSNTELTQSYEAGVTGEENRVYPIQLNSSEQMGVSVPWYNTNTTYSMMTDTVLGLGKLEDNTTQAVIANPISSTAGKTYGIQKNASDQLVVNVPWTDTTGITEYLSVKTSGVTTTSATDGEAYAEIIKFNKVLSDAGGSIDVGTGYAANAITIGHNGVYKFDWNVACDTSIVNNRTLGGVKLEKGTCDGESYTWSDLSPSHCYIYCRGNGNVREGSCSGSLLVLHEGDEECNPVYRLVVWKVESTNATSKLVTEINGTQMNILKIGG